MGVGRTISSIPFGFDRHGRPLRTWRRRRATRLRDCFAYPLADGPGIGLMIALPPFLAIMAIPVFDVIVSFTPENALNPINLLIVPFTLPLVISFSLTLGYLLLFLGRTLETSALGEDDHPRWPTWDRIEILEELGRWTWAAVVGGAVGGLPAFGFARICGLVGRSHVAVFSLLVCLGIAYAQVAVVAALLHDTPLAANPVTVSRSLFRMGRGYLLPSLVVLTTVGVNLAAWYCVLFHAPSLEVGVAGLWGCWALTMYEAMVVVRVLGTTYHRHAEVLGWFPSRPQRGR